MERTKIFISHAGADVLIHGKSDDTLQPIVSRFVDKLTLEGAEVFMSSNPNLGLNSAADLLLSLKEHIEDKDTNIFLVLITDNYLRSPFCIYELCLIQTEKQKSNRDLEVHYIYANQEVEQRVPDLGINSTVYCVLSSGEKKVKEFILKKENKIYPILKKSEREFTRFLKYMRGKDKKYQLESCNKPYIGQTIEERNEINGYVEKVGIKRLASSGIYGRDELKKHAQKAKAIYCVSTTGAGLLKTLKEEILPEALLNNVQFHMILPPRNSAFCEDVAMAETQDYTDNEIVTIQNKHRIYNEYEAAIQYLNEAYLKAKKLAAEENIDNIGSIWIHNSRTLLRQTIFLTEDRDGSIWGWMSATLPPIRSVDSPDILFECKKKSPNNNQLGHFVLQHCECLAKMDSAPYQITGRTTVEDIENKGTMQLVDNAPFLSYWNRLYDKAAPADTNSLTLIEIAAQHPLKNGEEPAEEFEARLNEAIRLYRSLKNENSDRVVKLYVPGSRHCEDGKCDKVSLSRAGIKYLKKNLSEKEQSDILKEKDTNHKYMPQSGVYNSMDECYVATKVYYELLEQHNYNTGQIICVCSPNQVMRKTFIYLRYGIEVMCHSVPIPGMKMYHNPVYEYFESLRKTIYNSNDWQNPENDQFIESRKSRSPRFAKKKKL